MRDRLQVLRRNCSLPLPGASAGKPAEAGRRLAMHSGDGQALPWRFSRAASGASGASSALSRARPTSRTELNVPSSAKAA